MEKKQAHKRSAKDANDLPSHIGKSFHSELVALVATLSARGDFKSKYLSDQLLTKYSDPTTTSPNERRSAAITKWQRIEKRNEATNARLMLGDQDFGWTTSDSIIRDTREIISKVLGTVHVERIFNDPSHTNGASSRVRKSPKALIEKHEGKAHVSLSALKWWYGLASETSLSDQALDVQEASVLDTVPKSTDIDRVICKEPEINMLLQRCVGGFIRRRLKVFGINLNDQTINQDLARDALKLGLATIDLSSASDSISRSLVMELLPTEWWVLLDDLRVHYTSVDGEIHQLQMFSAMGNGFTFELESLLFWALTRTICRHSKVPGRISVYGDDIIAPSLIGARLKRTFSWFGFTVNEKKSNWSGPFRESCGKHYHSGREVTPFYVRKPISEKSEMIRLLNRLLVWDADTHFKCFTTQEVADFHVKWSQQIPRELWGGVDPEDITSLVTGHRPRSRLFRNSKDLPYQHKYGLLAWLLMTNQLSVSLEEREFWDQMHFAALVKYDKAVLQGSFDLNPSIETRFIIANPEEYRDDTTSVYDAGSVTAWDPYMICGPLVVHHSETLPI